MLVEATALKGLLAASYFDIKEQRIPNKLLGVMAVAISALLIWQGDLLGHLAAGAVCLVIGIFLDLVKFWNPGDTKLFAIMGYVVGSPEAVLHYTVMLIFTIGAIVLIRRKPTPLAPAFLLVYLGLILYG